MGKAVTDPKQSQRLMSVDALRGFDMFFIVGGSLVITGLAQALAGPVEFSIRNSGMFVGRGFTSRT